MLFGLCLLAFGQLTFPSAIKGEPNQFITVQPSSCLGLEVQYYPLDGITVFPGGLLVDRKITVVLAPRPGSYRLLAYTSVDNKPTPPTVVTIEVGGGAPLPVPPNPPEPMPPQPSPDITADQLYIDLQSILGGLSEPNQKQHLAKLAGVFERGSRLTGVATVGQLYNEVRKISAASLPNDVLRVARNLIGETVKQKIGDVADSPVDPKKYGETFARISAILNKLAGE